MYLVQHILLPYIEQHKTYFIIYTLLSFMVYSIGSIVIPRIITEFINAGHKINSSIFLNLLKSGNMKGILYCLGILFVLFIILDYSKNNLESYLLFHFSSDSKKKTIKQIFYKYTKNYKELSESEVSWMIQQIYGTIRFIIRYIFIDLIPCIFMFLAISVYFYSYDKIVGSLFVGQFVAPLMIFYIYHPELLDCYCKSDTEAIKNNNYIGDKTKNLMNILFDNSVESELNHIMKKEDDHFKIITKCYHLNNKVLFINNIVFYSVFFLILYRLLYKDKKMISNILITYLIYKGIQSNFLHNTLYQYYGVSKFIKINRFIEEMETNESCIPIHTFKGIKLNNVSYKYDEKSDYILRNVNIHFKPDKLNILMGKSGSGKTTIMKLIIKMANPTKGDIYLDDTNSKDLCKTDIRDNIYYVNQRTILFDESVLYNLQYGNKTSKEDMISLLKKHDLFDYYEKLEYGIDTPCGTNGSRLSLGMQKIIMVIRGILKPNKSIVIYDEPLTSLDQETRKKIVKLIVNETKGKTIIVITHDPDILPYADHIVRL